MKKVLLPILALVLALGLALPMAAGASPDPGVVGLWHFDEETSTTAYDSSGYGNDGTLTNMSPPGCWVSGMFGNALSFDGSDDYVDCGSSSSLDIHEAITVEFWGKISTPDHLFMFYDGRSGHWTGVQFFVRTNHQLTFQVNNFNAMITDIGTAYYNSWHHFVAVYESGGERHFYIDGVDLALDTSTNQGDITGTSRTNIICARFTKNMYFVNGIIDEVRIWDVALTADEIALSYKLSDTGRVEWLPPVTNADDFVLQEGTTLPLKFQLFEDSEVLVTSPQPVSLEVTCPEEGFTKTYMLGDGVENLRWNPDADESYYIANLQTKVGTWPTGDYTATVHGIVTGTIAIDFYLSADKGVGRGKSGKP